MTEVFKRGGTYGVLVREHGTTAMFGMVKSDHSIDAKQSR